MILDVRASFLRWCGQKGMSTRGVVFYNVSAQSCRCGGQRGKLGINGDSVPIRDLIDLLAASIAIDCDSVVIELRTDQASTKALPLSATVKNYTTLFVDISPRSDVEPKSLVAEEGASLLLDAAADRKHQLKVETTNLAKIAKVSARVFPIRKSNPPAVPSDDCLLCEGPRAAGHVDDHPHVACFRSCCAECYRYACSVAPVGKCPVCGGPCRPDPSADSQPSECDDEIEEIEPPMKKGKPERAV